MIGVVFGGLGLLAVLAVVIGLRSDREARAAAWLRIATARRLNAENRREIEQLAVLLDVREGDLELRERQLDLQEARLLERMEMLAAYEQESGEIR